MTRELFYFSNTNSTELHYYIALSCTCVCSLIQPFIYLYFRFAEVDPSGELLADEGVWVMRPFEDSLESDELLAVERCPVSSGFQPRLLRLR